MANNRIIMKADSKQASWIFGKKKKKHVVSILINNERVKILEVVDEDIAKATYELIREYVIKEVGLGKKSQLINVEKDQIKLIVDIIKGMGEQITMKVIKKNEYSKLGTSVRLIEIESDKVYEIRFTSSNESHNSITINDSYEKALKQFNEKFEEIQKSDEKEIQSRLEKNKNKKEKNKMERTVVVSIIITPEMNLRGEFLQLVQSDENVFEVANNLGEIFEQFNCENVEEAKVKFSEKLSNYMDSEKETEETKTEPETEEESKTEKRKKIHNKIKIFTIIGGGIKSMFKGVKGLVSKVINSGKSLLKKLFVEREEITSSVEDANGNFIEETTVVKEKICIFKPFKMVFSKIKGLFNGKKKEAITA